MLCRDRATFGILWMLEVMGPCGRASRTMKQKPPQASWSGTSYLSPSLPSSTCLLLLLLLRPFWDFLGISGRGLGVWRLLCMGNCNCNFKFWNNVSCNRDVMHRKISSCCLWRVIVLWSLDMQWHLHRKTVVWRLQLTIWDAGQDF